MTRGKRWGSRKPRIALAGAVAAVAAMAFGAGSAQATTAPVAMTFNHGQVKLGGSGTPIDVVADGGPFPVLTADVCTDTATDGVGKADGDFTDHDREFRFPPATSDVSGVPGETATFGLIPLANVTGHYDAATGALTTNASNYQSDVTLAGPINAGCRVTPFSLAFSTAKQTPFHGDAFDAASSPPVNGVIDADWATLPTPGDAPGGSDDSATCASVLNVFTTGPGGIALGNAIEPVLEPPSSGGGGGTVQQPTAAPTKKKCKKAKKGASSAKKSKCKKKKK